MAASVAGRTDEAVQALRAALSELAADSAPVDGPSGDGPSTPGPSRDVVAMRVRVLVSLSLAEFPRVGLKGALAVLAEAEQLADALDDDGLRSRVEYQRAAIHGRSGDIATAWASLERTMRNLDDFTEREKCSVLLSRGMVAFGQGRAQDAAEAFGAAADLSHTHGFAAQEFMARHNNGNAVYLQGDLPRALSLMAEAQRVKAEVDKGPAVLDRAQVLLEAGLVSEAITALVDGIEAATSASADRQVVAEGLLMRARAYRTLGRLVEASEAADRAEAAFSDTGAEAWAAHARLVGLQVALDRAPAALDPAPAALDRAPDAAVTEGGAAGRDVLRGVADAADEVTAVAERAGDVDLADRARTLAAHALIDAGELDAASSRLEPGRAGTRRSLAEDLNRVDATARLAVASGDPATARRLLTRAAGRLAASGRGSASLDLRTASAVHGVRLAALDLDLSRARGASAVLASLERWRSVASTQPSVLPAADPVVAELTEQLRSVQRAIRDEPPPDRLRRLQRRAGLLEDRIRNRDWTITHGALDAGEAPLRIRDARDRLAELDRDLVWYFRDRDRLCGVGIIGGRATVRDLMALDEATELARQVRVDLRTATTQVLGPFRQPVWGSLRAAARVLDEALVRPWQSSAQGLAIVTDRSVAAFPWHALPSLAGVPLTVALSLTTWAAKSTTATEPAPRVHVAVGPSLDRAGDEARRVAELWRPCPVTVADPSSSAGLLGALRDADIVHVAAHGSHVSQSPLFSSVSLHDGPVFAYEAQGSGVAAGHVVLSACEVGTVTVRPGEETLGMAASLLSLGARSVVAAVAPVPDDVAADVMVRHHRGLAAGLASDEALAAAVAESDPAAVAFLALGGRYAPNPAVCR